MIYFILILIILYLYGIGLYFIYEFLAEGKWEWSLLLWPVFFILMSNWDNNKDN